MSDADRPREPGDPQAALRRKLQKLVESGALSPEELNLLVSGDGAAAATGGTAAGRGGAAVGGDVQGNVTVYNIEVAEHHNYFAGDVLVHNKSGGAPPCLPEKNCCVSRQYLVAILSLRPCLWRKSAAISSRSAMVETSNQTSGTEWPGIERVRAFSPAAL